MKKILTILIAFTIIGVGLLVYISIKPPLSVSEVTANQSNFHEQYIEVQGNVGKVVSVGGVGGYTLTDGEKSLGVIFKSGSSPNPGSKKTVKGKFYEAYNFFGKRQGVIIEGEKKE